MTDYFTKPRTGPNSRIVAIIDDSVEGDGAPSLLVHSEIPANSTVSTVLKINSISAGRFRWNVAGERGTWRNTCGSHSETITSGSGGWVAIEFDSYTIGALELSECVANVA